MEPAGESTGRDPLGDPENRRKVDAAKDLFLHLVKGLKQVAFYRHNRARWASFLERTFTSLTAWLEEWGALVVKIEAQQFSMYLEPLLQEETDLAWRFYRDGIRQLVFRPGIEIEELVELASIATTNYELPEHRGADILQDLWRASLAHVEYVVVEGFSIGDMSEEEVEVEVEQVVAYLSNRLRSATGDYVPFARLTAEDLSFELSDIDQVRGAVVLGAQAPQDLKERLQAELRGDQEERLLGKLVEAVFQVLEDGGLQDAALREDMFTRLLDAALLQEDFATISAILFRFRTFDADSPRAEEIGALRDHFVLQMEAVERLERIGNILDGSRPASPADVSRYLTALSATAVFPLLDVLERVNIPEHRTLIAEALARIATEGDPFLRRLQSSGARSVRDLLHVLELMDIPDKHAEYGKLLKHDNPVVRMEALAVIARTRTEQCRRYVAAALNDPFPALRLEAARLLPAFERASALRDLTRVVRTPEFERRSMDERVVFFESIGATELPEALELLQEQLEQRSIFNRSRVKEDRLLAIAGLSTFPSVVSFRLLQVELARSEDDPELAPAIRRAMHRVKKQLLARGAEA